VFWSDAALAPEIGLDRSIERQLLCTEQSPQPSQDQLC
jgi:hypothetical protein